MVLTLLIICIGGLILCTICNHDEIGGYRFSDLWVGLSIFFLFALIGLAVAIVILAVLVSDGKADKEKISMYTEENIRIETKVKETVKAYMDYEEKTYKNLVKDADLETLLIQYPKLNSNTLVIEEIKIYNENNKKIKELKENQIQRKVYKWWLYFGD